MSFLLDKYFYKIKEEKLVYIYFILNQIVTYLTFSIHSPTLHTDVTYVIIFCHWKQLVIELWYFWV